MLSLCPCLPRVFPHLPSYLPTTSSRWKSRGVFLKFSRRILFPSPPSGAMMARSLLTLAFSSPVDASKYLNSLHFIEGNGTIYHPRSDSDSVLSRFARAPDLQVSAMACSLQRAMVCQRGWHQTSSMRTLWTGTPTYFLPLGPPPFSRVLLSSARTMRPSIAKNVMRQCTGRMKSWHDMSDNP